MTTSLDMSNNIFITNLFRLFKSFNWTESTVSGTLQAQLGDETTTHCDTSNATGFYDIARRKRSLSSNVVEAINRPLDAWTNYRFFVCVATEACRC